MPEYAYERIAFLKDIPENGDKPYLSLEKKAQYLYEITFNELPSYKASSAFSAAGCSSFVKEGKLYRNLDWTYDSQSEFIVRFKDVVGMSFIKGLDDGEPFDDETLGQLPYRICDGANSSGIMVATHVLFNDFDYSGSGEMNTDITLLPYLVLTTMTDMGTLSTEVSEAIANLRVPAGLAALDMLIQILVTDGLTTKILTPKTDGSGYEYVDITSRPQLTNFKWVNKAVLTRDFLGLQDRPTGIERWNLISAGTTLEDLRFTLAYESSDRLSEFIGIDDTTKESTDAELEAIYDTAHAEYLIRQRDGKLWQTVHSVVYSANGMESLFVQENYERDMIASGGSDYEAGDGIIISDDAISVDEDYVALKSDLPEGEVSITIGRGLKLENGDLSVSEGAYTFKPSASDISFMPTDTSVVFNITQAVYEAIHGCTELIFDASLLPEQFSTFDGLVIPKTSVDHFNLEMTNEGTLTKISGLLSEAVSPTIEISMSQEPLISKTAVANVGGLVTPSAAPTSEELVGINTSNAQSRITIGSGLTLANGVLSASGGGGGGTQLYKHTVYLGQNFEHYPVRPYDITLILITNSATPYTSLSQIESDFYQNKIISIGGTVTNNQNVEIIEDFTNIVGLMTTSAGTVFSVFRFSNVSGIDIHGISDFDEDDVTTL